MTHRLTHTCANIPIVGMSLDYNLIYLWVITRVWTGLTHDRPYMKSRPVLHMASLEQSKFLEFSTSEPNKGSVIMTCWVRAITGRHESY